MAPRTTRTARNAEHSLKTDLQRRRDHYGFRLRDKGWPLLRVNDKTRPHHGPRGITKPARSNRDYQNVVHQSLMHTPSFLAWIALHKPDLPPHDNADCVKCMYRDLMTEYWCNPQNANIPISEDDDAVMSLAEQASIDEPEVFPLNKHGDAAEFYDWAMHNMQYDVLEGEPDPAHDEHWHERQWNEEFMALYQLDLQEEWTCLACNHLTVTQESRTEIDTYQNEDTESLADLIAPFFKAFEKRDCKNCSAKTEHRMQRRITAAPQNLRVAVQVTYEEKAKGGVRHRKFGHGWELADSLTLTKEQFNKSLSLNYDLRTALAHGGRDVDGVARDAEYEREDANFSSMIALGNTESVDEDDSDDEHDEEKEDEELALFFGIGPAIQQAQASAGSSIPARSMHAGVQMAMQMMAHGRQIGAPAPQQAAGYIVEEVETSEESEVVYETAESEPASDEALPRPGDSDEEGGSDSSSDDDFQPPFEGSRQGSREPTSSVRGCSTPYQRSSPSALLERPVDSSYILNALGRPAKFSRVQACHIADEHFYGLNGDEMVQNPQMPRECCERRGGYAVVYLTFERRKLVGKEKRMEVDLVEPWTVR